MAKIYVVNFILPYTFNEEYKAKNQPKIDAWRDHMLEITGAMPNANEGYGEVTQVLADEKQLIAILLSYQSGDGDSVRVKDFKIALETPAIENALEQFLPLLERMELAAARVDAMTDSRVGKDFDHDAAYAQAWNQKVGSPIPGPQLMQINRLMLAEDMCTDALQNLLQEGWRLIAVCPQEARRPDYILGKCDLTFSGKQADRA